MTYALLGKLFTVVIIFFIVWIAVVVISRNTSEDEFYNGWVQEAFWFIGPIAGLVVAVCSWIWLLP